MIEAKPCYHQGYMMRSQIERTVARMMDSLGIRWLYEPEVYQTDAGGYLPDFKVIAADVFIEVKGKEPTDVEIAKAEALARRTGCQVFFAYGSHTSPMHFDGVLLPVGMMFLVNRFGRWVKVPVAVVGQLVYGALGYKAGMRFAMASGPSAGCHAEIPDDRDFAEHLLAENNRPLNARKVCDHYVPGESEIAAAKAAGAVPLVWQSARSGL